MKDNITENMGKAIMLGINAETARREGDEVAEIIALGELEEVTDEMTLEETFATLRHIVNSIRNLNTSQVH